MYFVSFEGIDGCGKTTLSRGVFARLSRRSVSVLLTREPGGTPLGEKLRTFLLDPDQPLSPQSQVLLHFAARQQHLDDVIRPALQRGSFVLCDRFVDSTWAYQSAGLGVSRELIAALENHVVGSTMPSLTFIIDISVEESQRRCRERSDQKDRYQGYDLAFMNRVRQHFLQLAEKNRRTHLLLDGTNPPQYLIERVLETLLSMVQPGTL